MDELIEGSDLDALERPTERAVLAVFVEACRRTATPGTGADSWLENRAGVQTAPPFIAMASGMCYFLGSQ